MRRLASAALLGALLASGAACSSNRETTLSADFRDVGDLVNRANVQKSDSVVGRVSGITLKGWTAHVAMVLQPGIRLPVGTTAVVRSTSLLGEKFVDLQPPPDATVQTPLLPSGSNIPLESTSKTPELEEVFTQLGAILASGGLESLGDIITASSKIVQGQEDDIGRVLDGTGRLVASLSAQRDSLAQALDHLASAAATLRGGTDTIDHFLGTTDQVGRILAGQRTQLADLVVQLDRVGAPAARLMRDHVAQMDRQIKALAAILPQLVAAEPKLDASLHNLPDFAKLFAAAIPGDYIQLDVHTEGTP